MTKPKKAISAMSAASSLSDAQIKSLLIPHVAANQRLGLFYHQRIICSAQHAFRDPPFLASSTMWIPLSHSLFPLSPPSEITKMIHAGRQQQMGLCV